MKLNNFDLRQIFLANIEDNTPSTRKICPPPKKLLQLFREKKSDKQKTRIIDHIAGCYHCAQEFKFILKAIRFEEDMNQAIKDMLGTKKIGISPKRISWRFVNSAVGIFVILIIITALIIPNGQKSVKYRSSAVSQINLFFPKEKSIPKSALIFKWEKVKDSEFYVFELYDETLYHVWSSNKIFENNFMLSKDISSQLKANKTYFWMISAFFSNGRKMESPLKEILLTE